MMPYLKHETLNELMVDRVEQERAEPKLTHRQDVAHRNMCPRNSDLFVLGSKVRTPTQRIAEVVAKLNDGGFELSYLDDGEHLYLMPSHIQAI